MPRRESHILFAHSLRLEVTFVGVSEMGNKESGSGLCCLPEGPLLATTWETRVPGLLNLNSRWAWFILSDCRVFSQCLSFVCMPSSVIEEPGNNQFSVL